MKTTLPVLLLFVVAAHAHGQDEPFGKPVAFWLDRLRSKDLLERDEAVQVFSRLGPAGRDAAPLLKSLLKDASPEARYQAALALWNVLDDGTDAVPTLRDDFATMPPARRQGLLQFALDRKKPDDALFSLFDVLRQEPQFQLRVAFHLPTLGKAAIPHYAKWLDARPGKDRVAAIQATPAAFLIADKGALLVKYLKDPDPFCRVAAAATLAPLPETRDDALAVLVELAEAKDAAVGDAVLRALVNQTLTYRKAAAIYPLGLKHASLDVRLGVVRPMLLLHPDRIDDVLPILTEALRDPSPQVRYRAFPLLTELGPKGEKLVPVLMGLLKGPDGVRDASILLGALAPFAGSVGTEVGELVFADPRQGERYLTATLRPFVPHFADGVKKHLEGDDPARKILAARIAKALPPAAGKAFVPLLVPLLKKPETAQVALETLEAYGPEARPAAADVFAVLDLPDGARHLPIVKRALLAIRPEAKALDAMLDALKAKAKAKPTPAERLLTADIALLHPDRRKEAHDALEALLTDARRFDRNELAQTLEGVGPEDAKLVPALRAALKKDSSLLFLLDRVFVRLGPAAKEVATDLLEQVKTQLDYSTILRAALVIYCLDPERRGPADERIAALFLERLERAPQGDELNYHFRQLADLCQTPPGPTKALAPLLRTVFRDYPRPDVQGDLAGRLVELDPALEAEVVQSFEDRLGDYPGHPPGVLLGLLRIRPDHPAALAAVKRFLDPNPPSYPAVAARVAMQCEKPLPGVRELLEAQLKTNNDPAFRIPARVALMRYDGKLNPAWIDEIVKAETPPVSLLDLRWLGPLGRPLIPRIRALPGDPFTKYGHAEVAAALERAR